MSLFASAIWLSKYYLMVWVAICGIMRAAISYPAPSSCCEPAYSGCCYVPRGYCLLVKIQSHDANWCLHGLNQSGLYGYSVGDLYLLSVVWRALHSSCNLEALKAFCSIYGCLLIDFWLSMRTLSSLSIFASRESSAIANLISASTEAMKLYSPSI